MADLYLLAIKSRGEATFEIGERMVCQECYDDATAIQYLVGRGCPECDGLGYWWITNSGYRAHPWWTKQFSRISCEGWFAVYDDPWRDIPTMPPDAIDLFPAKQSKSLVSSGKSLLQSLGLLPKVVRRL